MNNIKRRGAFVSYSRKDKEFALEFARELKSTGYSVWLDQLDIPTGARWDDEVEKALHEYEIFLIILTPASVSSENVKDEIGYAIDHGKRIMPVLLEECDIPLRLRRFQYVDFTKMEFADGIKRARQLLENLLNQQSTPALETKPNLAPQKASSREATHASASPRKNKSSQRQWVFLGVGMFALLVVCAGVLGAAFLFRDVIFPAAPMEPPTDVPLTQPPTELPVAAPPTEPPIEPPTEAPAADPPTPTLTPTETLTPTPTKTPTEPPPMILWTIDSTGVCRDTLGGYPRWSEYNWSLSQCQEACQNNRNCQGFAMSKKQDYCQLFGSDGKYNSSGSSTQITQGDRAHPEYACYLKSTDQSILAWAMDSTGVCRDDAGGYPRWSEYNWTFSQCRDACKGNPNCQGFAMSKEKNYCQLFGSDGQYNGSGSSTQITKGDNRHPKFTCFIKR